MTFKQFVEGWRSYWFYLLAWPFVVKGVLQETGRLTKLRKEAVAEEDGRKALAFLNADTENTQKMLAVTFGFVLWFGIVIILVLAANPF